MKHAIVIGGGIAGLLATRVLVDHFERITLIERDSYPQEGPQHRPGTPQDRQVHTMLLRGQRVLEEMFPGLTTKLLAAGAVSRDYGSESLNCYGSRCPTLPSPLHGWNASRMLVEWQIRQEVLLRYPQVRVLESHEVVNLLADGGKNRVMGVLVRARGQTQVEKEHLEGDLVIDASGSGSQAPQWLVELGYPLAEETIINPHLGYTTRLYQADVLPWKNIAIQARKGNQRGGVLMEIEGGRWMVVLAGSGGDYPPTEEEGYLAFAQSLPDSAIFEAIKEAQPLSSIYGYRRTENRWRHFERMKHWPEGFIVIGDATCVFNPIYGQGMTVTALEALALDLYLQKNGQKGLVTRSFQKKVARMITLPWLLAASSDARVSQGRRPNSYIENLIKLLPQDQEVLQVFLEVIHMLRSPFMLLHPRVMTKVVACWLNGK